LVLLLFAAPAYGQGVASGNPAALDAPPLPLEKQDIRRPGSGSGNAKASATSRPATAKNATRPPADTGGFGAARVAMALGAVIALILLMRWVARRFFGAAGPGRSTRAVQVLSRSPVTPRQQLVVLRVGRRLLVVADGGAQMSTLTEITDPDEVASLIGQLQDDHTDRAGKSFGSLFGKMRGRYESDGETAAETVSGSGSADLFSELNEDDQHVVKSTRHEVDGLLAKMQMIKRQFKDP
jgi:flagellar biogenesis protein FliO